MEDPNEDSDAVEETDADAEEQPPIDDDEIAEIPDDLVDQVEAEAGRSADAESDPGEADDATSDEAAAADAESDAGGVAAPGGRTWGDMYVDGLTTLTKAVVDEHGDDDISQDELRAQADDLYIDEYFDEFLAAHGKAEHMPPEQALLCASLLFVGGVVVTETDLAQQLVSNAGGGQ
jgi:hypothetical protein